MSTLFTTENKHTRTKRSNIWLIISFITIITISFFISYIYGNNNAALLYDILSFSINFFWALLCLQIIRNFTPPRGTMLLYVLLYLLITLPAVDIFLREYGFKITDTEKRKYFFYACTTVVTLVEIGIISLYLFLILKEKLPFTNRSAESIPEMNEILESSNRGEEIISDKRENIRRTTIDKVVDSLMNRVNRSNRIINISLFLIVITVLIGGGVSFGTVVLSEATKIRELEVERKKLMELKSIMSGYKGFATTGNNADSSRIDLVYQEVRNLIIDSYGDTATYKKLLTTIESKPKAGWQDVAMRITIAALTFFLIQVFFHIYKYNQQQSSHLLNKAEVLELYNEDGIDQSELRSGLLSKIESGTTFDKTASTPTEQIINVVDKAKDLVK